MSDQPHHPSCGPEPHLHTLVSQAAAGPGACVIMVDHVAVAMCDPLIGVVDDVDPTRYVAVAIAGRPSAKGLDNGYSLEVLRVCSTGAKNAPSMLYGACARAGEALGYDPTRIYSYTRWYEPGTSLVAAGWIQDGLLPDREGWDCSSRPRPNDPSPRGAKTRWRAA